MKKITKKIIKKLGYSISKPIDKSKFQNIYKKYRNYTMIAENVYVSNLHIAENLLKNTEGDVVECGVWRGGMIAGLAELLGNNRSYHLFDSFEGLPPPRDIDGEDALTWSKNTEGDYYFNNCTAEISFANEVMKLSNATYSIHKGWFNETLPTFKTKAPIALLRLDGDWYDSTLECLKNLYPLLNNNGVIIIDDYYTWDGCSRAVHDYLSSIQSISRIYCSTEGVGYIIKKDPYSGN
ncbi:MAG: TylF/MycF/NovP-related O-methyltransferase [Sphingobacteriaceae bacterium]